MSEQLTLITPTSDRPVAFALCERWMQRQTHRGPVRWIVVDDGETKAPCTMGQDHIRRAPSPDRATSFRGNLLAGLAQVYSGLVAFIEDDDWYHPEYLARLVEGLNDRDLYGESNANYYNIATRCYRQCGNSRHASLCQTGLRSETLKAWLIGSIERADSTMIDKRLWLMSSGVKKLSPESRYCIGMKGLPGKSGIGIGHRLDGANVDESGDVLRKWIGEDAEIYFNLAGVAV